MGDRVGARTARARRAGAAVATSAALLLAGCTAGGSSEQAAASPSGGVTSPSGSVTTPSPAPSAPSGPGGALVGATGTPGAASSPAGTPSGSGGAAGLEAVPGIVAALQPSVVTVFTRGGNGSGVVYSADGLIVTNEHVVSGQTRVQVGFADGRRVAGTVRATDPVTDLAIVQAERTGLPAARFKRELPRVGELTVVIGSPLGFENSVSAGIVSGLHRQIPGSAVQGQSLVDLIQTDAAISPGNSGGAVANGDGEIIGISEAYIPPQQGAVSLGFAIPSTTAVDVVEQLRRTGRARHAYAGLSPLQITPEIAEQLGLTSTEGAIVAEVEAGGPAADAGLRPGDVIIAFDGKPTRSPEDFLSGLRPRRPGDQVTARVRRGSAEREVRMTLVDRPQRG